MKKTGLVLLVSILAFPLYARSRVPLRMLRSETRTGAVAQEINPADAQQIWTQYLESWRTVRSAAIADVRSVRSFIIPAAGSTAGGGGTLFFRSDVTVANFNNTAQSILVIYWQLGTSNPPSTSLTNKQITIPAGTAVTYVDFVGSVMQSGGLGTLVFIPISGASIDSNAAVDALSRIYTRQPGSTGTVSQEFPAVDPDSLLTGDTGIALGLRQDAGFRTNFGFVNFDGVAHVVRVKFIGELSSNQTTITVPAFGMLQTSAPVGNFGAVNVAFEITDAGTGFISWVGYATSTDNLTGDGWVSIAGADFSDADLDKIGFSQPHGKRGVK